MVIKAICASQRELHDNTPIKMSMIRAFKYCLAWIDFVAKHLTRCDLFFCLAFAFLHDSFGVGFKSRLDWSPVLSCGLYTKSPNLKEHMLRALMASKKVVASAEVFASLTKASKSHVKIST